MALNKVLKVNTDSELLSYIINVTPELASEIDLPVQGESIAPIGKLIMSNERYKNAFINAINLIGLTVIDRNYWEDPWENFTNRGVLNYGQSVRELAVDIADVFDYNEYVGNATHFLSNVVPNVYEYIHELNYQKFYKTTTSDSQMAMAFNTPGGLFGLIEEIASSLYEGYKYDKYIVNKYMLCRRIVDGTITSVEIPNYSSMDARERVAFIKNISNLMTFRNPNYNPAGLRIATSFDKQIAIVNTDFSATMETSVWATSFFRNDAELKTRMALIDGYGNHDTSRLIQLLGSLYVPFTSDELSALANVPVTIIDDEFFQDYDYSLDNQAEPTGAMGMNQTRSTSFYNPETLRNNLWLHTWKVLSTSPFKQAVVFVAGVTPGVTSVAITPSTATVFAGSTVQLKAIVNTTGFANKAVTWSVESATGQTTEHPVTVDTNGKVTIPSDFAGDTVVIKATSVYDTTKYNTATITVGSSTVPSVTSVTVSAAGSATTIAASATLQMSATVVKTGNASESVEWSVDSASATDGFTISATGLLTAPAEVTVEEVTVTATSVFDTTKKGTKKLTIAS